MKKILEKLGCNVMSFGLNRVAVGAASMCCCFLFYQPKAPENLEKFSKNK